MLSFQREPELPLPEAGASRASGEPSARSEENPGGGAFEEGHSPAAVSIGSGRGTRSGGPDRQQEYLTVAARGKAARKSTILLFVFFASGLLCLWLMINKSTPVATQAAQARQQESQIETAIARVTGVKTEMFNRMGEVLNKFYEFSDVEQVKVNELVKNPFKIEPFFGELKNGSDEDAAGLLARAESVRQQQLRAQAEEMELLTIMETEQGSCCMIDDKVLYEGDLINGFRVSRISDASVTLQWDGDGYSGGFGRLSGENVPIVLKLSQ